jgi:ABC-type phosphate/phosphonate transport system substrate-binding protein
MVNRHFRILGFTIIFTLALLTGAVLASEKEMLLCLPGFPGTEAQAQPYVDKMLRHLEIKLKLEEKSMSGVYIPDGGAAVSRLAGERPEIALVGPSVYVSQKAALGMKVIAKIEVNGRGQETYSIVTKEDGPESLAELPGKTMEGAVVHDAKYVYNVLLDRKLADGQLTLKSEKRPQRALRNVARGDADAAIVDQSVLQHMNELPFAADLKVIYTSKPVPAPAVVVMGEGAKNADKLKGALVGMCGRPDGAELCKTLTISSIKAASDDDYKNLLKDYNR